MPHYTDEQIDYWESLYRKNPSPSSAVVLNLMADLREARRQCDALTKFKAYVHQRFDEAGIPTHPDGPHSKEGCRVGDRFDILVRQREAWRQMHRELLAAATAAAGKGG